MNRRTFFASLLLAAGLFALPLQSASAQVAELLSSISSQLGVSETQAAGGTGALFNYAKSNLGGSDFASITSALPGVTELMSVAPSSSTGSSSLLDQGASLLDGGSGQSAGGLMSLASTFTELGMSSDMINQFVPIILDYAEREGGQQIMSLLQSGLLG